MTANIFPRYSGAYINLDGREADLGDGGDPTGPVYALVLTLSPEQIEPGQAATATLTVTVDGSPLVNHDVSFTTSNPALANVDEDAITSQAGKVVFQLVGLTIGVATITASIVVNGVTYTSNGITLLVVTKEAAENYDATGYGRVVLKVENAVSNMLFPRPQRLSHMEQNRKGGDTGLARASSYEGQEVVFMPAWMLR